MNCICATFPFSMVMFESSFWSISRFSTSSSHPVQTIFTVIKGVVQNVSAPESTIEASSTAPLASPQVATQTPVTVKPALPTVKITATPQTIQLIGTSTIKWEAQNATSCTLNGSPVLLSTTGVETADIQRAPKTYSIKCTGSGGSASASVTVNVEFPQGYIDPSDVVGGGSNPKGEYCVFLKGEPSTQMHCFPEGDPRISGVVGG